MNRNKYIIIFLLAVYSILFTESIIPHVHSDTANCVTVHLPTAKGAPDPQKDEDAAERIHSARYLVTFDKIKTGITVILLIAGLLPLKSKNLSSILSQIILINKYFLLKKILNLQLILLNNIVYKAPPRLMIYV